MADGGYDSAFGAAARRLEEAVGRLQQRLAARAPAASDGGELAAELAASRAREQELAAAGEQASAALSRAIAEIRAALGG